MARKKDFHFDFNEDADPSEEIYRLREATSEHFKTMKAIAEYMRATPTAKEMLAELDAEIAQKKAKAASPRKVKATPKTTASRRKVVKRLAHA